MYKLIISNNSSLKPLYDNIDNHSDITYSILTELECISAINKNDFDMALISPLVYAAVFGKQDFRIVPDKMLILEDYSNLVTINIRKNKEQIKTIFFTEINEYLIATVKLLLGERFGIHVTLINDMSLADVIVSDGQIIEDMIDIDLSEDWYDTFEIPLFIGFWIVNQEKYPDNIIDIVNSIAKNNLSNSELTTEKNSENEQFPRQGRKYWVWKEEYRGALEEMLDMLYYHNYANHIADVKLLNETYESFSSDE